MKRTKISNSMAKTAYYPVLSKSIKNSRLRMMPRLVDSRRVLVFFIGVFIGVTLALMLHHYQSGSSTSSGESSGNSVDIFQYFFDKSIAKTSDIVSYINAKYNYSYETWLKHIAGGYSVSLNPDNHRFLIHNDTVTIPNIKDAVSGFIEGTEAHFLYNKIPVICVVFSPTSSKSISSVVNTWGQHCNSVHFYYSTSRSDGVRKESTKLKGQKHKFLSYNDTASENKLLKEKVYVINVPEAKSEISLYCRAFHNIFELHRQSQKVIIDYSTNPERINPKCLYCTVCSNSISNFFSDE